MLKKYLLSPGPVSVPEEVLIAMAKPLINHRTPEFYEIFSRVRSALKPTFGTEQDILVLASSGTGAMEAAIANTLSANDSVLVIDAGKFGARWGEIAIRYALDVHTLKYEWGHTAKTEDIKNKLDSFPQIKAVLIQGSETSTTVYHPVKEIAQLIKNYPDTILVVDGITSVGVYDTQMDKWGVDILLSGSQKAFMLPPGLSFIALSEKAWQMASKSTLPKYYFDLKSELKSQKQNSTACTPSVSLIYGLDKVMELISAEGLPNVYRRHEICADATRKALTAMGLNLLAKDCPSNAATAFFLPEGIDGKTVDKYAREKLGITYAGGQDHLTGKIIRVSHLGYHGYFDTITGISGLEMALKIFGHTAPPGAGVAACENIFVQALSQENSDSRI